MTPRRRNQIARAEAAKLLREGLLDAGQYAEIIALYPDTRWDWTGLGRWFSVFGAVSAAAGAAILIEDVLDPGLELLALALGAGVAALLGGAQLLARRRPLVVWTRRALELCAGLAVVALSFTLGALYGSGSGNWPALLLADLVVVLSLAYALGNPLLLTLSAVVFFCWFGGFTGYASGWGAYWFGMSYPLRFVLAAVAMGAVAAAHLRLERGVLERWRGFGPIWLSAAAFFAEMALWLLALFGNFDLDAGRWHGAADAELVAFNLLWLVLNVTLVAAGARTARRMLVGYGATFLVIQAYTLFFWHLAAPLGPLLSLLIAGGATLWLALALERRLRRDG